MKGIKFAFVIIAVMVVAVSVVFAASEASIEKGKALFNDPNLGSNGKTCSTCHQDGKGLEKAGGNADLAGTINQCIAVPLKGKALDPTSPEMQSLIMYVKSFSAKKPAPHVGC